MPTPEQNNETKLQLLALGLSMADALEVLELRSRIVHQSTPVDYPTLKDKIRAEKKFRTDRYAAFARLVEIADEAGVKAGDEYEDKTPAPAGGCGFAWVTAYSDKTTAGRSFVLWAVKSASWTKHYRGGIRMSVSRYDQNEGRKMAYASAFAQVLRDAGIQAYPGSRLD